MTLDDLRQLDLNDIGRWPGLAQAMLVGFLCVLLGAGGYWFVIKAKAADLQAVKAEETALRSRFELRQRKAAALEDYKIQLAEMEARFGTMLGQLPGKKEVASLLQDVSQLRVASGLEEQLFQPEAEQKKDFYAELPIRITLNGSFHQYGEFAQAVAALPRIVTLHDIELKQLKLSARAQQADVQTQLVMDAKAKTYRYLEDGE